MSGDRLTGFIDELIDHLQSSESDVFTVGNQIKEIGRILRLLSERIDRLERAERRSSGVAGVRELQNGEIGI